MQFDEVKIINEPKIAEVAGSKVLVDADSAIIFSCYNTESLDEAKSNFIALMASIKKYCNSDDLAICLKSKLNFRTLIEPSYKEARHKYTQARPIPFVSELKQALLQEFSNILSVDLFEADDLIIALHTKYKNEGTPVIVSAIDKDVLKNIEGEHFNYKKNCWVTTTKEEAVRFKFVQSLAGDATDGIKGIPKVGPKKAEAMLQGTKNLYKQALAAYQAFGLSKDEFLKNLRLVSLNQCFEKDGEFYLKLES